MAMDVISDDEWILRHIPSGTTWQAPGPRITSKNFELRTGEKGVSVSREAITTSSQLLKRLGREGSRIARAQVGEIRKLGLDVVPDRIDPDNPGQPHVDPGHAEIRSATASLSCQQTRRALSRLFVFLPE